MKATNIRSEPKIYWISPSRPCPPPILDGSTELNLSVESISTHPTQDPTAEMSEFSEILVTIDASGSSSEVNALFERIPVDVLKIIYCQEELPEWFDELLSRYDVFSILWGDTSKDICRTTLSRGLEFLRLQSAERIALQEFRSQNRHLETFTKNLEDVVSERTRDIQDSKNQIELKVRKVQQLISFIKNLSSVRKIEDIVLLLRSEIQKLNIVAEPFLACDTGYFGPWILYYRRGDVSELKTAAFWKFGPTLRINDNEDQQYLANAFTRPFNRVLAFPLQTPGRNSRNLTLFVEHQLSPKEIDGFIDYMGERLQSLTLAIDRSLFEIDLKRASFLWESTFDSIDDPIAIFSIPDTVIRSNNAFVKLQNEMIQDHDEAKGSQLVEILERCLKDNKIVNQSVRIGPRYYDCNCYPIVFHQGEWATSAVVHLVDVTNYKSLQSVMIQNEKMSAVGHLAGNIAHELNNPLTGIRSLCQILLKNDHLESSLDEDIREVEAAAHRSQKIINNLLSFAKHGDHHSLERVSLRQLVNATLPLLKSIISDYHRSMEFSEDDDFVLVEPHLTQQVIFNLVSNACQAMGGRGELTIQTMVKNGFAQFVVIDTGPGVAEALGSSIFEPFVTSKMGQGGTGLGLSMSKKVVERFGGQIGFESQDGQGSRFWFRLPLAPLPAAKVET